MPTERKGGVVAYKIAPDFFSQILPKVYAAKTEFSGSFVAATDAKGRAVLKPVNTITGHKYARVPIQPSHVVNWHSHPSKCGKTVCALDIPSPKDMINIIRGACNYNTQCHIIFAKSATYVISIPRPLVNFFRAHPDVCNAFCTRLMASFMRDYNEIVNDKRNNYASTKNAAAIRFRKRWLNKMRHKYHFRIKRVKPGVSPVIYL